MAYTSQYLPGNTYDYAKASTELNNGPNNGNYRTWATFYANPGTKLVGLPYDDKAWQPYYTEANQALQVNLGSGFVITRIYYENGHNAGADTLDGVKNFTFWGSNSATAFAETSYAVDTDWTQLTTSQSTFDQHIAADQADPKYITVTNSTAYQYYRFKFVDTYGVGPTWGNMMMRHIELQTGSPDGGGGNVTIEYIGGAPSGLVTTMV